MTPKPIDFTKVEALRKHMLLTTANMAELLGVSRQAYHGWVHGKSSIRKTHEDKVRVVLKKLLAVMTEHGWPMPEVIAATQERRMERLRELIND